MISLIRLRSLSLLGVLALSPLAFTACDDEPYNDAPPYQQGGSGYYGSSGGLPPQRTWTQNEHQTFNRGFDAGRRDKSLLRTNNYKRYSDDFNGSLREYYAAGYAEGYGSVAGPTSDMNPTQRGVYNQGYSAGQQDYASGRGMDFRRHRGQFPHVVEPFFQLGYEDAFQGIRPR